MRASVRNSPRTAWLSALLLGVVSPAFASTNGLYLPPPPTGSGGEDAIETSTGTRCRQSINSNGAYLDVGVTGTGVQQPPHREAQTFFNDDNQSGVTAYARVTIPLGRKPQRIDCSQVYQLELDKLRREVELLRMGVK